MAVLLFALPAVATGQACTTQAAMTDAQREAVGTAAFTLASAVQSGNAEVARTATIPQFANDFGATAALIRSTAPALSGDTLQVRQAYLLDASSRKANDASDADFSCALKGSAAETDFSISGLPPGRYAFVSVEASGAQPWVLPFLLQAGPGGQWLMAGFYPHARRAAGHDGLWYWNQARSDDKDGKPWLAWLLYGEADQLLRPADFVSSTNLDRLRSEERSITPPALADGLSDRTPLVLTSPKGTSYRITGLSSAGSEDGRELNLVVHLRAAEPADPQTLTANNLAAAGALLDAHPDLRAGFSNVYVIAETPGSNPVVTQRAVAQIAAAK